MRRMLSPLQLRRTRLASSNAVQMTRCEGNPGSPIFCWFVISISATDNLIWSYADLR
jgi:hypothetical protein